ncbi:hypothetical protein [Streptomyces sp. NPDC096152]|uniref:hypothetical protein n=1 Tax=Streptomyces sp. NPDC096152 TaxID=3366078 RepID=UPI0037F147DC
MNGKRTFLGLALVTGLAFSTACASGHSGSRSKNVRASSTTPSASASKRRQSEQQLVVITWCDTLNAGYRAQQKFTLDGSRVGSPVYFNVTPVDAMTSATQAGCMHSLSGAELRSVFTADYDTIVTTKTDNGSRHAGFEYSVSSVPETSDGGAADPTPNNFFDLTGIPADSLMKVLDTPGAVGPDKKVYFTREVDGETGSDATFQLMAADPNTPAKPVRALEEGGTVFFPPNATKPSISTTGDVSGHAVYVKGGAYGFEGTQDGLNFGTQS